MEKFQKQAGLRSRILPKNALVSRYENVKNLHVLNHGKILKTCRSVVTEKYQKLAGLSSQKNTKNLRVCGHRKITKTRKSAGTKKFHKCLVHK